MVKKEEGRSNLAPALSSCRVAQLTACQCLHFALVRNGPGGLWLRVPDATSRVPAPVATILVLRQSVG
jgi:hypothetical protein